MKSPAIASIVLRGALATALFTSGTSASTIASWDLAGAPGDQSATAGSGSANVSALDLARGSGLGGNLGSNSLNSNGWNGIDADDYVTFGFTVAAGFAVDLDSLLLGTRSSSTGPGTLGLYSSIDGFATSLQTFLQQPGQNFEYWNIDLSSLGTVSGSVEFRIYELGDTRADGAGATASGGTFRVANYIDPSGQTAPVPVTVTGMLRGTTVPDGGTSIAMLGLALCAIGATRKLVPGRSDG